MKTILQVEDDPNDVFFLKHAMAKAGVANPIQIVNDGREAIDYLKGVRKYADREQFPLPSLVLLDLKLPKLSGLDVLKWIRQQPAIQTLPVTILSSSNRPEDLRTAYARGANSYLVKPPNTDGLVEMVVSVKDFWLDPNQLPPESLPDQAKRHALRDA